MNKIKEQIAGLPDDTKIRLNPDWKIQRDAWGMEYGPCLVDEGSIDVASLKALAAAVPEWVPFPKRVPDDDALPDHFDVTLWRADEPDYYEVVDARYDVDGRWIMGDEMDVTAAVIAWMPKPQPYQEDKDDERD